MLWAGETHAREGQINLSGALPLRRSPLFPYKAGQRLLDLLNGRWALNPQAYWKSGYAVLADRLRGPDPGLDRCTGAGRLLQLLGQHGGGGHIRGGGDIELGRGPGGNIDARTTVFSPSGVQVDEFDSNIQQVITLPETGAYLVRVQANTLVNTGSYDLGLDCP